MIRKQKLFVKLGRILIVVFCCTALFGCNSAQIEPLPTDAKILAFGDSLTFGVGSKNDGNYPKVLSQLTGLTVVNSGISGETTTQGLVRFQSTIDQHQPDLVILLEGGNDILRNHPAERTRANLARMIEMAQASGVAVLLVGVPEKKLFSSSAPFYQQLADEYALVFEKRLLGDLLRTSSLKSDPIHFNNAGYKALAEGIYQRLREHGALE